MRHTLWPAARTPTLHRSMVSAELHRLHLFFINADSGSAAQQSALRLSVMWGCSAFAGITLEPGTGTPALVMRYYSRGSLRSVLDERPDLDLATRLRMAREIAWGMRYLHARHHEMVSPAASAALSTH